MDEVKKKIYVVDDDERIRLIVMRYLEAEGYAVTGYGDGESALQAFAQAPPDMFILDIMMPGIDGLEVCRKLRATSQIPIIMVSAKDDEIDRIVGLELGSDDYLSKPFSPRELLARVKTVFRRFHIGLQQQSLASAPAAQPEHLAMRDLKLFPEERRAQCQAVDLPLTTKEYDLLYFFARHLNKAFTREQLLTQVWGYDYIGDERAIDDLVKRLRKKLKAASSDCEIKTVWGYGYKVES
ncbi:response regulator transcription factor [Tumebacillus permanentifrigoris]|uniref:DNA-binding response OmpR family regulator n=1 Tax=Tumebacillus permanentifrigoris TaxID=378543 RepID=A0A316DAC2_9BACL|nr:response regulator transcription factor [Tumebacillus permanentifrigoris]PWK13762.1 DNA-binding response OmpR family regulator [Tumebacillus permanentifrigoris]